jgi:excinuclease UvrABC nuclease subunit
MEKLTFSPEEGEGLLEGLPASPAVFLLRGEGEPYVSKTANLRRRLERLLGVPKEQSKRLNLRDRVREVEYTLTGSDFESQFLIYQLLRESFPRTYAARLRLRPAPLIKLHLENEYPRASVTTRLGKIFKSVGQVNKEIECHSERDSGTSTASAGTQSRNLLFDAPEQQVSRLRSMVPKANLYFGPFQSRTAAEKFANDALDFFKMRRCVEDLHPDPAFPGCVYSEMKMCLAPCFKGCTDAEYHAEVARVQDFFSSAGDSLSRELAAQRDRASGELAFEEAAAVHARMEKLKPVLSQCPEIIRRIDQLDALVVQPSAETGAVALFRFCAAILAGPTVFKIEMREQSRSMESQIAEIIASFAEPSADSVTQRVEHLAILKRWYYRSTRVGEIFFADEKGNWPFRRIVRGIGRVARGEKPQEPATFSAPQNAPPTS